MTDDERKEFEAAMAACNLDGITVADRRDFEKLWLAARRSTVPASEVRELCEAVEGWYEGDELELGDRMLEVAVKCRFLASRLLAKLDGEGGDGNGP